MAVRWRFGGGSGATRWRLVTGRRRLVADRHGGGGAPQRVAGRLVTGRRAPRYGSPGALLRGAIRGAIRPRGANKSSPRRPECKSPYGPPLAPWRSANGAPCGSSVVGRAVLCQICTASRVTIALTTRDHLRLSADTLNNAAREPPCAGHCSKNEGKPLRWTQVMTICPKWDPNLHQTFLPV